MSDAAPAEDIVYVVHGTNVHQWWRAVISDAGDWWMPESGFSRAIRSTFPEPKKCLMRWHWWTGANRDEARIAAGVDLAEEIRTNCSPEQRVHIVGHSHGGNVALLAANRLPPHRISTIVLLANPNMTGGPQRNWCYWGEAPARVPRICNLYSPEDTVQSRYAQRYHGFRRGTRIVVEREYPDQRVINAAVSWAPGRGRGRSAHSAMHSSKVGFLAGRLMQRPSLQTVADAMAVAGLRSDAPNEIVDTGSGPQICAPSLRQLAGTGDPSPFDFPGDGTAGATDAAVLFIHGFTASPAETRPLAEYIHRHTGFHCRGILLPGHGTTPQEMEQSTGGQWRAAANAAYQAMAGDVRSIFLVGISMGASLCCLVAKDQNNDPRIKGLILLAPAFAVSPLNAIVSRLLATVARRRFIYKGRSSERYFHGKNLRSYNCIPLRKLNDMTALGQEAFDALDGIQAPILIMSGALEHTVSVERIFEAAGKLKRLGKPHGFETLALSQHILTVEPDRDAVFKRCLSMIKA